MTIVGLGNPTKEYTMTRHNVGMMFLDWLSGEQGWESNKNLLVNTKKHSFVSHLDRIVLDLVKPQVYMNESGEAVSKFLNFYKINPRKQLILAFDDLDMELGNWKLQREKGPKVHNGLNSVEEQLGTKDFLRLRIGIYNPLTRKLDNGEKMKGSDYVLQRFTQDEIAILYDRVFPQIKDSLALAIG